MSKQLSDFSAKLQLKDIPLEIHTEILLFCEESLFKYFTPVMYKKIKLHTIDNSEDQKHFIDKNVFIEFKNTTLENYAFDKFVKSKKFNDNNISYLKYLLKNTRMKTFRSPLLFGK